MVHDFDSAVQVLSKCENYTALSWLYYTMIISGATFCYHVWYNEWTPTSLQMQAVVTGGYHYTVFLQETDEKWMDVELVKV